MKNKNNVAQADAVMSPKQPARETNLPFYLILLYLFFEFGRPQALVAPLRHIPIPSLITAILIVYLFTKAKVTLRDKLTMRFLLLLGLMLIHIPLAMNNYWAFQNFKGMSFNFIAFLSLVYFVNNEERFHKLVVAWTLINVFVGAVGFALGGMGAGGFLGDENDLCLVLNMALPFPFFLALTSKKGSLKLLYLVISGFLLLAIIVTQSRGGFLGLVAVSAYCWGKSNKKLVSAVVVVILMLVALMFAPASYWDEIRSIAQEGAEKNPSGTGAARLHQWRTGWIIFLNNPIIGIGQGNFRWNVGRYEEAGKVPLFYYRSMAGREAHSMYFSLLPELGLIGIFLFGSMTLQAFLDMMRIRRSALKKISALKEKGGAAGGLPYESMAAAITASLIGYLTTGVFISVLYYPCVWVMMGFALSLKRINDQKESIAVEPNPTPPKTRWRRQALSACGPKLMSMREGA